MEDDFWNIKDHQPLWVRIGSLAFWLAATVLVLGGVIWLAVH